MNPLSRDRTDHPSDEALLLFLDGETATLERVATQRHLESCVPCRVRMSELQHTLVDVVQELKSYTYSSGSADAGSYALLKLRLRSAAMERRSWLAGIKSALVLRPSVYVYAGLLVIALAMAGMYRLHLAASSSRASVATAEGIPDRNLTPGAIRPVTLADICPLVDDDLDPELPPSTQQVVFREYGIQPEASASAYQVDYLINPQLGGTDDIRNLWPEPYDSPVWNAHVKDALEDRLHQMVCNREIDLASAQREIATDWISAYKKYFHSPKPV